MTRSLSALFVCLWLAPSSALAGDPPAPDAPAPEPATPEQSKAAPADAKAPPPPDPVVVHIQGEKKASSASETIVRHDVIAAAPHQGGSELMSLVPGVFITQHSGQGKAHQIFLRGFDAQHGQDIEIWAAGAPVNEVSNVHGQGYADMHFIIPEVVKQIRAMPGTYDVHQGDFAVAGSMAFDLGYDEPGFTVSTTLGSFWERRMFLAYHPPNWDDETFAAFEAEATDGFGPNRAARRVSTIGQIGFDIASTVHVKLMASFYAGRFDSAGVIPLSDIQEGKLDPFSTLDPNQGGDSMRVQVVGEVRQLGEDENTRDRYSFSPFFVARDLRLRSNFTGYLEDAVEGDNTQQTNQAKTVGALGRYSRRFDWLSKNDEVELGIYARTDWIDQDEARLNQVNDRVTKPLVDAEIRATDVAGWAQAELTAAKRVRMVAGLRIDGLFYRSLDRTVKQPGAERSAEGFHIGPKATVDVLAFTGFHALASFGMGFRSPQARSLGNGEPAPFTEVYSFEGGARYSRGPELAANLAAFHTRLSQDLVFDEALVRNEPVGATARTGFSVEVNSRPTPWFVMSSSVTYSHAEFTEDDGTHKKGDLLPYAPEVVARADLGVQPKLTAVLNRALVLKAGTGLSFVGVRPLPYSELGTNIFLADATLGLRWKEIEIKGDFYNLFNAQWYDGEFTYASSFEQTPNATLVPRDHVSVGYPFTAMATISGYL